MDAPRETPFQEALEEAHRLAVAGDFQRAGQALAHAQATAAPPDAPRLEAARRAFRLDPAALAVVALTALALLALGALTLFH